VISAAERSEDVSCPMMCIKRNRFLNPMDLAYYVVEAAVDQYQAL
jgi:hypothetical protein